MYPRSWPKILTYHEIVSEEKKPKLKQILSFCIVSEGKGGSAGTIAKNIKNYTTTINEMLLMIADVCRRNCSSYLWAEKDLF